MSAPKHTRVFWAVSVCLAALVLGNCRSRDKETEQIQTPEPVGEIARAVKPGADLGLSFSPGGPDGTSLIILRLFSGTLRQMELDNASKKEGRKTAVEPLRLSIPRESWAGVQFRALEREGSQAKEAARALAGVVLVEAPESESVRLGPHDTLTAVYRISTANLPPPETLVRAEMKLAADVIRSEAIPVPAAPDTEKGLQFRQAEIHLKLKSWREAKTTADGIIERYPDEPAGYWLKGQALEGEGFDAEALKLYNIALDKSLAKKDADQHEPPLPIMIKIRDLEEKISPPAKK